MKKIPTKLFQKVEDLAKSVLTDFHRRGYVIPVEQSDGRIKIGAYIVGKNSNGFYSVTDSRNNVYADNLNLKQTAALIANDLALGKILDTAIIDIDKTYGYRLFDQQVYENAAKRKKNTLDQDVFYETRCNIARVQKEQAKQQIFNLFRKLTSIR
jgi:hypothetical protein